MSAVEYEADALAVREENVQAADETGSIHSENTETAEDEFNLEKIIQVGLGWWWGGVAVVGGGGGTRTRGTSGHHC